MNYYQFHIGDYASHTRHLSLMEDLAYRRLLDLYYLNGRPFGGQPEDISRLIGMRDHQDAVNFVLSQFFCWIDDEWINKRCDEEIAKYESKVEAASRAGLASAKRRTINIAAKELQESNDRSTGVQPTNNQEPITNNQIEKAPRKRVAPPDGVSDSVWQDFLTVRRAKKAPMTDAALDGIKREAEKAGWTLEDALKECCARGWQGFKADWVAEKPKPVAVADVVRVTVPAKQGPDPALQKIISDQLKAVPPSPAIRAKMDALRVSTNTPHPRTGTE